MGFRKALFLFAYILPVWVGAQNPQPEEHISKDGKLEVTLTVDWVTSLDGERIAPGYNGKAMGPTLRVKPGDTVTVNLINNLEPASDYDRELYNYLRNPMSDPLNATIIANRLSPQGFIWNPAFGYWGLHFTNLHFHGAMFDPKVEDFKSALGGGESKTYVFQIPEDQPPLIAWYHNHYHGNNVYSMLSGLYGFIIIEGTDSDVTKIPGVDDAKEVLVMLGESNVDPDTKIPTPIMKIGFTFGWTAVTNGEKGSKTVFTFDKGEKVLFRIASATTQPDKYLSIDNHTMLEIARDGYPLRSFEEKTRLDMEAGSRLEFMTTFDTPGTYVMRIKEWNVGHGPEKCTEIFGKHVDGKCISFDKPTIALTVVVLDNETTSVAIGRSAIVPKPPEYHPFLNNLAAMPSARERNVTMSLKKGRPFFQIPSDPSEPDDTRAPDFCHGMNDQFFTPHVIHGELELGTCETWNVFSDAPRVPHPFHVHSVPYLVKQYEGQDVEIPFWRDTFQLNTSMVVHICFPRYTGDIVVHCHMARHQDIGMSATYRIVPPGTLTTESGETDIDMNGLEDVVNIDESEPNEPEASDEVESKGKLVETWRIDIGQKLYPEGIAYDAKRNRIILSSLVSPILATFDVANDMEHLVTYTRDGAVKGLSNLGLALDPNIPDRVWTALGSLMTFDGGRVAAYDISPPTIRSKEAVADVSFSQRFACQSVFFGTDCGVGNDLIVAEDGFVYITDTALGRVFRVDSATGTSIEEVVNDPMLKGTASPFGANGILYHPNGFLIIANTGNGALYRFDLETNELSKIGLDREIAPDGLLFLPDGRLVMVSGSTSLIVLSDAGDDWKNAIVDDVVDINFMQEGEFATTIALGASDLEVYVTFVRFGEVQGGNTNEGPTLIGKVLLEKASSSDSTSENGSDMDINGPFVPFLPTAEESAAGLSIFFPP